MTATVFNQFKKLYDKIPDDRKKFVTFIRIRIGTKFPMDSFKTDKKSHLNFYQVKNHMMKGGNIGVLAIKGGIMFLDIDTDKENNIMVNNEVLSKIPETFTVKTRSGGLHFYLLNNGEYNNQNFYVGDKKVGELRTDWQYVLSPGSWVENTYIVINDIQIADFTGEITKYFQKGEVTERVDKIHGVIGKQMTDQQLEEHNRKKFESDNDKANKVLDRLRSMGYGK